MVFDPSCKNIVYPELPHLISKVILSIGRMTAKPTQHGDADNPEPHTVPVIIYTSRRLIIVEALTPTLQQP